MCLLKCKLTKRANSWFVSEQLITLNPQHISLSQFQIYVIFVYKTIAQTFYKNLFLNNLYCRVHMNGLFIFLLQKVDLFLLNLNFSSLPMILIEIILLASLYHQNGNIVNQAFWKLIRGIHKMSSKQLMTPKTRTLYNSKLHLPL